MNASSIPLLLLSLGPLNAEEPPAYDEALVGVVAAVERGAWDEALAGAERLVADATEHGLREWQLAEAQFARGVVLARRDQEHPSEAGFASAVPAFESARALAGPGRLRLDATYDLGLVHLFEAERWRAQIPELAGAPPAGAAPDASQPDPLQTARAAYLAAKEPLIERLRADWRDEDTRANLELIQRRLRELDEIERQREEERQQEEQQNQQGEGEGEPDENQDEQGDGEDSEQVPSEENQRDPESEDESRDPGEGEQNNETEEVERPEGAQEEVPPPAPSEPQERHLTREEVMRLMDKLAELEEQARALQQALQEARRIPVERDW